MPEDKCRKEGLLKFLLRKKDIPHVTPKARVVEYKEGNVYKLSDKTWSVTVRKNFLL